MKLLSCPHIQDYGPLTLELETDWGYPKQFSQITSYGVGKVAIKSKSLKSSPLNNVITMMNI